MRPLPLTGIFYCLVIVLQVFFVLPLQAQVNNDTLLNWVQSLRSKDQVVKDNACFSPPTIKYSKKDLQVLFHALKDDHPYVRINILFALGEYQLFPEEAIPRIIALLENDTESVREQAAITLIRYGKPVIKPLLSYVSDDERKKGGSEYKRNRAKKLAEFSLKQIGAPVLNYISSKDNYRLSSLKKQIIASLSGDDRARLLGVESTYRQLNDLLYDSDSFAISKINMDTVLSNEFLRQVFIKWANNTMNREAAVPLIPDLFKKCSNQVKLKLLDELPVYLLIEPTIFSNLIWSNQEIIKKTCSVLGDRYLWFRADTIWVSRLDLDRLVSLLKGCDDKMNGQLLRILNWVKLPSNVPFRDSEYEKIIRLLHCESSDSRFQAYKLLIKLGHPELKQFALNGLLDAGEEVRLECLKLLQRSYAKDPAFPAALSQFIFKQSFTKSYSYYMPKAIAMIDSVALKDRTSILFQLDGMLKDTSLRIDYIYPSIFEAFLNNGKAGLQKVLQYYKDAWYKTSIIQALEKFELDSNEFYLPLLEEILADKDSLVLETFVDHFPRLKWCKRSPAMIARLLSRFESCESYYERRNILETIFDRVDSGSTYLVQFVRERKITDKVIEQLYWRSCKDSAVKSLFNEFIISSGDEWVVEHLGYCDVHYEKHMYRLDSILKTSFDSALKESVLNVIGYHNNKRWIPALVNYSKGPNSVNGLCKVLDLLITSCNGRIDKDDTIIINCLLSALRHTNNRVQITALRGLGLIDSASAEVEAAIVARLHDNYKGICDAAVQSMLNLNIPLEKAGKYFLYLIDIKCVHELIDERDDYGRFNMKMAQRSYNKVLTLHSRLGVNGNIAYAFREHGGLIGQPASDFISRLPWPPPPSTGKTIISDTLFRQKKTTGDIYKNLMRALYKCGYQDNKVFTVDDGFAILTKLERITNEGIPAPTERWSTAKIRPLSISDYLASLLWGSVGKFRTMLFVITPFADFEPNGKPMLNSIDAYGLYNRGSAVLPVVETRIPFFGKYVHVLIYEFNKKSCSDARIIPPGHSSLTIMDQLEKTKIINYLVN